MNDTTNSFVDRELVPVPKAPRKPRPSEIAAKLAKTAKPKPKKLAKRKPASKKKKTKATKRTTGGVSRPERLDMRLSKAEKAKILAKAKKLRRTVTSIVYEAIEKMK
jgi:hypothetical protein